MRVDFSGGGRQIGFKQDVTERIYDSTAASRSRRIADDPLAETI